MQYDQQSLLPAILLNVIAQTSIFLVYGNVRLYATQIVAIQGFCQKTLLQAYVHQPTQFLSGEVWFDCRRSGNMLLKPNTFASLLRYVSCANIPRK